jgi:predicted permease
MEFAHLLASASSEVLVSLGFGLAKEFLLECLTPVGVSLAGDIGFGSSQRFPVDLLEDLEGSDVVLGVSTVLLYNNLNVMRLLGVVSAAHKEDEPFSLEGSQVHFSHVNLDLSYLSTEVKVLLVVDSHITSGVSLVSDLHVEIWREVFVTLRNFSRCSQLVIKGITELSLLPVRNDRVVHFVLSAGA